jgi:hypothetical protein
MILPLGVFMCIYSLLLLIVLVIICRKRWLAIAIYWMSILLFAGFSPMSGHWSFWVSAAVGMTIFMICLTRFGLLAMLSGGLFIALSSQNALTANFSSWYFSNTIFAAVVLFSLSLYGFHTSLAGKPIFQAGLLEKRESL